MDRRPALFRSCNSRMAGYSCSAPTIPTRVKAPHREEGVIDMRLSHYPAIAVAVAICAGSVDIDAQQRAAGLRADGAGAAVPTPRTADGHPDLSGLWNGRGGGGGAGGGGLAAVGPGGPALGAEAGGGGGSGG